MHSQSDNSAKRGQSLEPPHESGSREDRMEVRPEHCPSEVWLQKTTFQAVKDLARELRAYEPFCFWSVAYRPIHWPRQSQRSSFSHRIIMIWPWISVRLVCRKRNRKKTGGSVRVSPGFPLCQTSEEISPTLQKEN